MEGHNTVFIQKIRKPLRKVLVKYGIQATDYFSYCAEVGCTVRGILLSMDSLCGEPVCLWLPEKYSREAQPMCRAWKPPWITAEGCLTVLGF